MHDDLDDLDDDLSVIQSHDVDILLFDDKLNDDDLVLEVLALLFCLLTMADIVDLPVLLDAEPNDVDNSAEDVQDVVDAVSNNVDIDEEGKMLEPDG